MKKMDFNRNHLDELSNDADKLRTKSCIIDLTKPPKQKMNSLNTGRSFSTTSKKSAGKLTARAESMVSKEEMNLNTSVDTNKTSTQESSSNNNTENSLETHSTVSTLTLNAQQSHLKINK